MTQDRIDQTYDEARRRVRELQAAADVAGRAGDRDELLRLEAEAERVVAERDQLPAPWWRRWTS